MATRKKAAAKPEKRAESAAQDEKAQESAPKENARQRPRSAVQGVFPLDEGEGFYTRTVLSRLHYGAAEGDEPAIRMIQQRLEVESTGHFDEATRSAVYDFQRDNDLPVTGIVDKETWDSLAK